MHCYIFFSLLDCLKIIYVILRTKWGNFLKFRPKTKRRIREFSDKSDKRVSRWPPGFFFVTGKENLGIDSSKYNIKSCRCWSNSSLPTQSTNENHTQRKGESNSAASNATTVPTVLAPPLLELVHLQGDAQEQKQLLPTPQSYNTDSIYRCSLARATATVRVGLVTNKRWEIKAWHNNKVCGYINCAASSCSLPNPRMISSVSARRYVGVQYKYTSPLLDATPNW